MDHGEPAGNTGPGIEFESEESATVERTDRSAEGDQLKGSELEEPLRTPRPKLADSTTADTIRTDVASGAESFATQLAGGPSSDPPDVSGYADILNSMKAKKRKAEESDELDDDLKPAAAQSRVASPTATNFKPIAPSPTVALENLGASDDAAPKNDDDYLSEGNKGALTSSSDDDAPHPDGFRAPPPIEALIGKLALEVWRSGDRQHIAIFS